MVSKIINFCQKKNPNLRLGFILLLDFWKEIENLMNPLQVLFSFSVVIFAAQYNRKIKIIHIQETKKRSINFVSTPISTI